ncbi:hypothetical protein GOBAR_AA36866 [Gossypium barbadense]|uniref:Uncharacterized protein n=1 Tax=Gossypium barbadense TaxID=3634 RepID=A0A2P5VYC7_GOSBA|nr:hypothetical protein GOBAR_AA36866 [Gossypium barbadense]
MAGDNSTSVLISLVIFSLVLSPMLPCAMSRPHFIVQRVYVAGHHHQAEAAVAADAPRLNLQHLPKRELLEIDYWDFSCFRKRSI